MLKTFDGSTMTEVPSRPSAESTDNSSQAPTTYVANPSALLPEPPRRRQRRSCDACRRSKRACDAEKCADFTGQPCSNCLRKNQACTFNWLKAASETNQDRERKRIRSSPQSSNESTEGSATLHHGFQGSARYEAADGHRRWGKSFMEEEDEDEDSNITPTDDADNEPMYSDELVSVRSRKSYGRGPLSSSHSQQFPFTSRFRGKRPMRDDGLPLREAFLGERSSRGFVTNGLLRIYNDSMENALSCWLTEHNCPYTLQKYKPSVLSAGKANREWGSSWGNRMYNRVIQLDRAYNSLRIRALTAEEERTVSKALNMAVVAFASQWAQAGERGTQPRVSNYNLTTDEFPESNYFERSMQESLWHQTSQILHRAAGIDSFRVVFAMIIFSLTQRPLDISRPFPHSTSKLHSKYDYFKNLIQDDDAPIFLELALRQMMAQRRALERAEQEMPRRADGEPQDPLRQEDRDTFNLLYWLGVMFDTLSAAISQRTVVVDDEDCELPRPQSQESALSTSTTNTFPPSTVTSAPLNTWPVIPNLYTTPTPFQSIPHGTNNTQFQAFPPGTIGTMDDISASPHKTTNTGNPAAAKNLEDQKIWGNLFMRDSSSQASPQATRWPCSYKVAAATLSSAAPVKVLLYRRVSQIQTLISRRAAPERIESAINAAFQVYTYWNRTYAPFISDCIAHHTTLPTRIQSWYILLAGHWHLGVFLLSDLLATIDNANANNTATSLSLPHERACRQASNLVATLRRQNALAVADLSLASIHGIAGQTEDGDNNNNDEEEEEEKEEKVSASTSTSASASARGVGSKAKAPAPPPPPPSARPEFHFALNQAALLTEPWTIVFVRSLCRAGYILVQIVAASTASSADERAQARVRCADCIEGLWYLGRKSDMAFLAARCLSSMLDEAVSETNTTTNTNTSKNTTTKTTTTATTEDEDEDDDGYEQDQERQTSESVFGTEFHNQSPQGHTTTTASTTAIPESAHFAPTAEDTDCTSFFQPWSMADIMGDGGDGGGGYQDDSTAAAAAACIVGFQDPDTQMSMPDGGGGGGDNLLDFDTSSAGLDPSSVWDFNMQP